MWYNVDVSAEVGFTISVDAASPSEAEDEARKETARRIRHFDYLAFVDGLNVRKSEDQRSGKVR